MKISFCRLATEARRDERVDC